MWKNPFILFCVLLLGSAQQASAQTHFTLKQAIQSSSEHNRSLQAEKYSIQVAEADITTAGLRPNPVLNNQSLFLLRNSLYPQGTGILSNANRQVWYQLTKPFQLQQLREKKIAYAQLSHSVSKLQYSETARNLSYEVANQWLSIWLAKVNLVLLLDAKDNVDTLIEINKNRLKNQAITPTELLRTQLLSDQYILQVKTIRQQYRNQLRSFKVVIGTADSADIDDQDTLESIRFTEHIDTLLNIAHERRQDYNISKSTIGLANQHIKVQKALSAPYFEAGLVYNPQNAVPYAGTFATLSIPLFDRNQGEIQKARSILDQSKTELVAKELQIDQEVRNAFHAYTISKENIRFYKDIVKQSQKVLSTVRYSYLKGNTTIIDFLEAQRSNLETQRVYFQAYYDYRKSYIDLLFATGLIMDFIN